MAATIKQIAELAGVSRGTVDRALNNRGGVSQEVEKRINSIAKQLNYQPNVMAKALANSHKKLTIAVIINSGGNPFFDKVLLGIMQAKKEAEGFKVAVIIKEITGYDIDEQIKCIDTVCNKGGGKAIHGLVITPINDERIKAKLNEISEKGIAIVTLNADVTGIGKLAFVGCHYFKSGQTAGELMHHITGGKAAVGIVTGSNKMLGHTTRIDGFKDALSYYPQMSVVSICEGFDNDEKAYCSTKKMLAQHREIDSLYFCAAGVDGGIRAVKELVGNGTHQNIRIISVDDTDNIKEYLRDGTISLTVCQQPFKQGYDAIQTALHWLIESKRPPHRHIYTQSEIKNKYNIE